MSLIDLPKLILGVQELFAPLEVTYESAWEIFVRLRRRGDSIKFGGTLVTGVERYERAYGGQMPVGTYRARFWLDEGGSMIATRSWSLMGLTGKDRDGESVTVAVCFLPKSWDGKRVSREVVR